MPHESLSTRVGKRIRISEEGAIIGHPELRHPGELSVREALTSEDRMLALSRRDEVTVALVAREETVFVVRSQMGPDGWTVGRSGMSVSNRAHAETAAQLVDTYLPRHWVFGFDDLWHGDGPPSDVWCAFAGRASAEVEQLRVASSIDETQAPVEAEGYFLAVLRADRREAPAVFLILQGGDGVEVLP